MFGHTTQVDFKPQRIAEKAKRGIARSIAHGAAIVRKVAQQSIVRTKKNVHSLAGTPVFTHGGTWFRRAILFDADDTSAVIGPAASRVGDVGAVHEFGETRGRTRYPKRPTMGPALDNSVKRFAEGFRGSIGE